MLSRLAFCLLPVLPATMAAAAERPVVVELFTSEGCSSCPPADAYLTDLARDRPDVLPLAFHVTYWNRLGWADPYSLALATDRQARYGTRFGDGSYTPEMVIDGSKGVVGSDRGAAEAAIAAASRTADTVPVALRRAGEGVTIAIGAGHGRGRVLLLGYDAAHRTAVGRGENTGRTLLESNIVRAAHEVGTWTGEAITLPAAIPAGEALAVLLEAPDGHILGAARLTGG